MKKELQPEELGSGEHSTEKQIRRRFAPVSHSTLWRWCNADPPSFPKPLRCGSRKIVWRLVDVEKWCESLEVAPAYRRNKVTS